MDKLKLVGDTLIAAVKDVPRAIYEVVRNRGYKRVSSEIYPNYKDGTGSEHGPVLRAVAFLGGDIPAVDSLADIAALYGKTDQKTSKYFIEAKLFTKEEKKKYPIKFIVEGVGQKQLAPNKITIKKEKLAFSVKRS